MSKEKQIEEMLVDIIKIEDRFVNEKLPVREIEKYLAKALIVDEGYSKQSEVAKEVISEFKTLVKIRMIKLGIYPVALARTLELVEKKLTEKYTEV